MGKQADSQLARHCPLSATPTQSPSLPLCQLHHQQQRQQQQQLVSSLNGWRAILTPGICSMMFLGSLKLNTLITAILGDLNRLVGRYNNGWHQISFKHAKNHIIKDKRQ